MEAGTSRNICSLENNGLREVVIRRTDAESRPTFPVGKADDTVEETGESTRCTAGVRDPASKERGRSSPLSLGQLGYSGRSPTVQRKAAAFAR